MRVRTSSLASVAVSAVMVAGLAACGGADNSAACDKIVASLKSTSQEALKMTSDPSGVDKVYTDSAAEIRTAANSADGDVKTAGTKVADAMDQIGKDFTKLLADPASGQIPDTTALTNAGEELQNACT